MNTIIHMTQKSLKIFSVLVCSLRKYFFFSVTSIFHLSAFVNLSFPPSVFQNPRKITRFRIPYYTKFSQPFSFRDFEVRIFRDT